MPCIVNDDYERAQERASLIRMLCYVMGRLSGMTIKILTELDEPEATELKAWWDAHVARDTDNRAREDAARAEAAAREVARKKLTPDERRILGL